MSRARIKDCPESNGMEDRSEWIFFLKCSLCFIEIHDELVQVGAIISKILIVSQITKFSQGRVCPKDSLS